MLVDEADLGLAMVPSVSRKGFGSAGADSRFGTSRILANPASLSPDSDALL